MTKGKETEVSSAVRVITIIEALSQRDSINLENLSKETELPKATLLRFLSTLINLGYVFRDDNDHYSLTLKLFSVGSRSLRNSDLVKTATPFAKALRDSLGETVHMGVKDGDNAIYLLKKESRYTIRMHSRIGKVIPLYCTAIGKIILSDMSEEEIDEYLASTPLIPFTKNSVKNKEELLAVLKTIQKNGWAMDNEEHEENIKCIGAPIRDYSGKIIAAMSVSWPLFRYNEENFDRIISEITTVCSKLSLILGYQS